MPDATRMRSGRYSSDLPNVENRLFSHVAALQQQVFHRATIDVFQRIDEAHFDVFINFMNAAVRWAELDNLRTNLCNEATIGRAASSRQFRGHASL